MVMNVMYPTVNVNSKDFQPQTELRTLPVLIFRIVFICVLLLIVFDVPFQFTYFPTEALMTRRTKQYKRHHHLSEWCGFGEERGTN